MNETIATACPVCGELIEMVNGYEDKQIECSECGELFRVVSLEPLQLAHAYDVNEEGEFYHEDTPHRSQLIVAPRANSFRPRPSQRKASGYWADILPHTAGTKYIRLKGRAYPR